jgi:hypothetical protein
MTDTPSLDPRLEELLGKRLLGEASPQEEEELRAAQAANPDLAQALELLAETAPAFGEAGLEEPNPPLDCSPERLRELVAKVPPFASGPHPLWLVFFWGIILAGALRDGLSLATAADPRFWWIPGLALLSVVHSLARRLWTRRRLEAIATGGPAWSDLVHALEQPLTFPWRPVILRSLFGGGLFLVGLGLFLSPPALTLGLAEGYRQLLGLALVSLSSLPLVTLYQFFLPIWVRALESEEA